MAYFGEKNVAKRPEVRLKLSIAAKNRLKNKENHPMYGRNHSDESKIMMSIHRVGKYRGEKSVNWHGGTHISKDGYKYIYSPYHPYSTKSGYVLEHRLVMEKHIGRFLNKKEVVHHIDTNRLNNSIDNLELIDGSGKHLMRFHNIKDKLTGRFIKKE